MTSWRRVTGPGPAAPSFGMEDKQHSHHAVIQLAACVIVTVGATVVEQQFAPDVARWIGACTVIGAKAFDLIRRRHRRGRHRRDVQ